jgi:hypothetical protein
MSMGWDCVSELLPPTVHPTDDIWVWRATVEWYWHGKTEELVPVPLCPSQIRPGPTRTSAVRSWRLTAWATVRPGFVLGWSRLGHMIVECPHRGPLDGPETKSCIFLDFLLSFQADLFIESCLEVTPETLTLAAYLFRLTYGHTVFLGG